MFPHEYHPSPIYQYPSTADSMFATVFDSPAIDPYFGWEVPRIEIHVEEEPEPMREEGFSEWLAIDSAMNCNTVAHSSSTLSHALDESFAFPNRVEAGSLQCSTPEFTSGTDYSADSPWTQGDIYSRWSTPAPNERRDQLAPSMLLPKSNDKSRRERSPSPSRINYATNSFAGVSSLTATGRGTAGTAGMSPILHPAAVKYQDPLLPSMPRPTSNGISTRRGTVSNPRVKKSRQRRKVSPYQRAQSGHQVNPAHAQAEIATIPLIHVSLELPTTAGIENAIATTSSRGQPSSWPLASRINTTKGNKGSKVQNANRSALPQSQPIEDRTPLREKSQRDRDDRKEALQRFQHALPQHLRRGKEAKIVEAGVKHIVAAEQHNAELQRQIEEAEANARELQSLNKWLEFNPSSAM